MGKQPFQKTLWGILLLGMGFVSLGAQGVPRLVPGKTVKGQIEISGDDLGYATYMVQVPTTAYALELTLEQAAADLDLYIKRGEEISNYDDVDFFSSAPAFKERLYVSRMTGEGLQPGTYYVDVLYQLDDLPVIDGRQSRRIPFRLKCDIIYARVDAVLSPGKTQRDVLQPEEGMFRTYKVTVPDDAQALRIDLFDTDYDLDLFVSRNVPLLDRSSTTYKGESYFASESLVINALSPVPLAAGDHYISVVDQMSQSMEEEFSLVVSFDEAPPAELLILPRLGSGEPPGEDRVQYALDSTVQVVAEDGLGSGTLLSREGLILTNYHVIEMDSGGAQQEVGIALNRQNDRPPRELFLAKVLFTDEEKDLALLKITKGLYGQSLPGGYAFPWIPLGDPGAMTIADPLIIIGYPGIGGTGSRVSITYTAGVVSGYERTPIGLILKTDSEMNYGNSGGAALNGDYELIGVPSSVVNEDAGQIGYIHPVNLLPAPWLEIIRREQAPEGLR